MVVGRLDGWLLDGWLVGCRISSDRTVPGRGVPVRDFFGPGTRFPGPPGPQFPGPGPRLTVRTPETRENGHFFGVLGGVPKKGTF